MRAILVGFGGNMGDSEGGGAEGVRDNNINNIHIPREGMLGMKRRKPGTKHRRAR
jgi:hypothetical protein